MAKHVSRHTSTVYHRSDISDHVTSTSFSGQWKVCVPV